MLDTKNQKAAYIELINDAAKDCKDVALLDLVYKLLAMPSEPAPKPAPKPKKPAPVKHYDPEEYRPKIYAALEACTDGYSMGIIYGFVYELLGIEKEAQA